jgi:hypothetical protein
MMNMISDMLSPHSSSNDMFSFMQQELPMALGSSSTVLTSSTAMKVLTSVTALICTAPYSTLEGVDAMSKRVHAADVVAR